MPGIETEVFSSLPELVAVLNEKLNILKFKIPENQPADVAELLAAFSALETHFENPTDKDIDALEAAIKNLGSCGYDVSEIQGILEQIKLLIRMN